MQINARQFTRCFKTNLRFLDNGMYVVDCYSRSFSYQCNILLDIVVQSSFTHSWLVCCTVLSILKIRLQLAYGAYSTSFTINECLAWSDYGDLSKKALMQEVLSLDFHIQSCFQKHLICCRHSSIWKQSKALADIEVLTIISYF